MFQNEERLLLQDARWLYLLDILGTILKWAKLSNKILLVMNFWIHTARKVMPSTNKYIALLFWIVEKCVRVFYFMFASRNERHFECLNKVWATGYCNKFIFRSPEHIHIHRAVILGLVPYLEGEIAGFSFFCHCGSRYEIPKLLSSRILLLVNSKFPQTIGNVKSSRKVTPSSNTALWSIADPL